jgi:small subunit ribosomal protein S20
MAHHKSAIRQERRSIRRKAINTRNKSALRTEIRKVREAVDDKDKAAAKKLLPGAFAAADKTAKKRAIHKNKASRIKSRLSRRVAALAEPAAK